MKALKACLRLDNLFKITKLKRPYSCSYLCAHKCLFGQLDPCYDYGCLQYTRQLFDWSCLEIPKQGYGVTFTWCWRSGAGMVESWWTIQNLLEFWLCPRNFNSSTEGWTWSPLSWGPPECCFVYKPRNIPIEHFSRRCLTLLQRDHTSDVGYKQILHRYFLPANPHCSSSLIPWTVPAPNCLHWLHWKFKIKSIHCSLICVFTGPGYLFAPY